MYMIRSGMVNIYASSQSGVEEELARLGPGDFFGETTLTAPAPRTASARTLENTELVGLFSAANRGGYFQGHFAGPRADARCQ